MFNRAREEIFRDTTGALTPGADADPAIDELLALDERTWSLYRYLPAWIWINRPCTMLLFWLRMQGFEWRIFENEYSLYTSFIVYLALICYSTMLPILFSPCFFMSLWFYTRSRHVARIELVRRIRRSRGLLRRVRHTITQDDVKDMMFISATLYAFYKLIKLGSVIYKHLRVEPKMKQMAPDICRAPA